MNLFEVYLKKKKIVLGADRIIIILELFLVLLFCTSVVGSARGLSDVRLLQRTKPAGRSQPTRANNKQSKLGIIVSK